MTRYRIRTWTRWYYANRAEIRALAEAMLAEVTSGGASARRAYMEYVEGRMR